LLLEMRYTRGDPIRGMKTRSESRGIISLCTTP
jgi:hypothetical protein